MRGLISVSAREHPQSPGGLREGGAIILPSSAGDRGGDLTLRDRFRTRAFSEGGCVGADHGNPDALGAFDLVAVVGPGFPGAAAVVGGDDEGRFVPVLGHGLESVPESFHEAIHVLWPFADIDHNAYHVPIRSVSPNPRKTTLGFCFLNVVERGLEQERIENKVGPEAPWCRASGPGAV